MLRTLLSFDATSLSLDATSISLDATSISLDATALSLDATWLGISGHTTGGVPSVFDHTSNRLSRLMPAIHIVR
jgi:hypothetical protein